MTCMRWFPHAWSADDDGMGNRTGQAGLGDALMLAAGYASGKVWESQSREDCTLIASSRSFVRESSVRLLLDGPATCDRLQKSRCLGWWRQHYS